MRTLFIVNPAAGGGRGLQRWASVAASLAHEESRVVHTRAPGEAWAIARAQAPQYERVVAVGGDGTAREVASGVVSAGASALLGLLPVGTGNDLAWQLGLDCLPRAAAALHAGVPRTIDVIHISASGLPEGAETMALVYAAAGFAGQVLRRTTPEIKRWFGRRAAYTVGFLRALLTARSDPMEVTFDGQRRSGRFLLVSAGNAELAGGGAMRLSPGAALDDGHFNVTVADAMGRLRMLRYFLYLLRGTHPGRPGIRYALARELTVRSPGPVEIQADGDVVGVAPARFILRPGALRVLAPGAADSPACGAVQP